MSPRRRSTAPPSTGSPTDRFREAVLEMAAGTPYTVVRTDHGFDVTLDVVDDRFTSLFARHHVTSVALQRISVDERRERFTLLDGSRTVAWSTGVSPAPFFAGSAEGFQGRVIPFGRRRTYTWGDVQGPPTLDELDFSVGEGHALVRAGAARAGLAERLPWQAKLGLVMGIVAIVGAAITVVVLPVLWWNGYFDSDSRSLPQTTTLSSVEMVLPHSSL